MGQVGDLTGETLAGLGITGRLCGWLKLGMGPGQRSFNRCPSVAALQVALHRRREGMVRWLVEEAKVDVEEANAEDGFTVFILAARKGMLGLVRWLALEKGANPRVVDSGGNDAAYWAAYGGHVEMVSFLVRELGFDVGHAYPLGRMTLLHLAVTQGHLDLVKWLVGKAGASVKAVASTGLPSQVAASLGKLPILQYLVQQAGAGAGLLELSLAASEGHLETVKWLVEKAGVEVRHAMVSKCIGTSPRGRRRWHST